jgi:hypothetical protein
MTRRKPTVTATTEPALFTVREIGTGRSLVDDPDAGWRSAGAGTATSMGRAAAESLIAMFGGALCQGGGPLGGEEPPRPTLPEGKAAREREKKGERLARLVAAEDWRAALKLAASFANLGDDKDVLQRAWQALERPAFTRELGRDPEKLVQAGKEALRRRFAGKRGGDGDPA